MRRPHLSLPILCAPFLRVICALTLNSLVESALLRFSSGNLLITSISLDVRPLSHIFRRCAIHSVVVCDFGGAAHSRTIVVALLAGAVSGSCVILRSLAASLRASDHTEALCCPGGLGARSKPHLRPFKMWCPHHCTRFYTGGQLFTCPCLASPTGGTRIIFGPCCQLELLRCTTLQIIR